MNIVKAEFEYVVTGDCQNDIYNFHQNFYLQRRGKIRTDYAHKKREEIKQRFRLKKDGSALEQEVQEHFNHYLVKQSQTTYNRKIRIRMDIVGNQLFYSFTKDLGFDFSFKPGYLSALTQAIPVRISEKITYIICDKTTQEYTTEHEEFIYEKGVITRKQDLDQQTKEKKPKKKRITVSPLIKLNKTMTSLKIGSDSPRILIRSY